MTHIFMPEVCPVALEKTGEDIRGAVARGQPGGLQGPQLGVQSLGTEAVPHQKTGQAAGQAQDWPAAVINSSRAR